MTKIKLCGLRFDEDINCVNELLPEYIGFVFWNKSKRYIEPEDAYYLKQRLDRRIKAVGVFVDEPIERVEELLKKGIIDIVQLHGDEGDAYIHRLKLDYNCEVIKAFKIRNNEDVLAANNSTADMVLLDSGMGSGEIFDWTYIKAIERPYILAGGLTPENVNGAVEELKPYGVDASSSLETGGKKDAEKMRKFVEEVRKTERI
ncbi:MAG: phosphoribosylanthranilate isomerase [Lachnospiraceae bacterium]|nr:phosphoribosylanthranilate isomerase [Lachnospiraceae bacterium]